MSTEEARKLFVAGLPDSITEDVLRQLFEATGGVVSEVSLPKDRATGRPRGFGFVTMASDAEAQSARDSLDGSMQAGKSISVRPFQAEPPRRDAMGGPPVRESRGGPGAPAGGAFASTPDRTIYVGNLPYDATQVEVETLFTNCNAGPMVRVSLPTDEEGRKRGFGFVTMASAEVANAAIEALRGADLRGRSLILNIAHPKGDRPAREPGTPGGYNSGGGSGGFASAGGPRTNNFGPPAPSAASGRKNQYDKKRSTGEAEGGARKKSWDRERSGRGRPNDWDE